MDKYEYKVRANEINELIDRKEYVQAAELADTIDWRRVKSVMMLCKISDLYKINRRYEDAKDMLLLAYERRPGGRMICYSLCELSIKMEEYVQAIEYYKEYMQAVGSTKDAGCYILQYKLYESQDVSLEERIAVLEKLKECEYREKWGYELAYLYHRVGLASRCVEECDELFLWFGASKLWAADGKYVIKALELKMLHQPLTPEQQEKYDHRFDVPVEKENAATAEVSSEVADSVPVVTNQSNDMQTYGVQSYDIVQGDSEQNALGDTQIYQGVQDNAEEQPDEMDIHVKTMDVGQYNTINLQAELAAGLREVLSAEPSQSNIADPITRSIIAPMMESDTESLDYPGMDEANEEDLGSVVEEMEGSEVFFGETAEIGDLQVVASMKLEDHMPEEVVPELSPEKAVVPEVSPEKAVIPEGNQEKAIIPGVSQEEAIVPEVMPDDVIVPEISEVTNSEKASTVPDITAEIVMEQLRQENTVAAEPPKSLAHVLSQEADGQIRLVMPEKESIEKQITGQISLTDILAEWERMKKENQEKREAEVRQHVLQQTGTMFTEFEAAVRDGLLEQLERGKDIEPLVSEDEAIAEEPVVGEEAEEEESSEVEESVETEEIPEIEELTEEPIEEAIEEIVEPEESVEEEIPEYAETFIEAELSEEIEAYVEAELIEEAEYVGEENSSENDEVEELEEIYEEAVSDDAEVEEAADEYSAEAIDEAEENIDVSEEIAQETIEELPEEVQQDAPVIERDKAKIRALTREEKELYAPFIQSRSAREQLVKAIDNVSLAAYTGNIIITGEEGMDTLSLAKNMIREMQATDSNFLGKVAKISGRALNNKDVAVTIEQLKSGALIIAKASEMNEETTNTLYKSLQKESLGIVIVLEDTKKAMDKFLNTHKQLKNSFTARVDVEALSNDMLVAFGKQYARELEYSIDELGVLALHTRIEELQTIDHAVTVVEVKEIVDEAIDHANRKTLGHFFDILFAKRYDEEDMIILSEKDFV